MPKKVEGWEKDKVIELYLKHYTEREIEGETGISHTTQRKIVKEFIRESEKLGIDASAELHGVSRIIEETRRLSGVLRTNKVSMDEAMEGVMVAKRLKQIGVTEEKVLEFVDEVLDRCEKKGFTIPELVKAAKELSDVEVEADMSYDQVVADFRVKSEKNGKLQKENESLAKEGRRLEARNRGIIEEGESKKEELLEAYNSTEKDLKLNRELHRRLREVGADPADLGKLIRMVKSAREVRFSPESFASKLGEEVSVTDRLRELGETKKRKEVDLAMLSSEIKNARARMTELNREVAATKKELDDLTAKRDLLQYGVKVKREEFTKLEADYDASANRIDSLEEVMEKNGVSIRLFKEPTSLSKEEVGAIVVQLRLWSRTMPARILVDHPAVQMWINNLANALGGS